MKTLFYFLCGLVVLPLLFAGCRKDDDDGLCPDETNPVCPDYDPCWDRREPVSADFRIKELPPRDPSQTPLIFYVRDTLGTDDYWFEAMDSTAQSYTWRFGTDPTPRYGREVYLNFPCQAVANQTIAVTLVTERPADSSCLDPGLLVDTLTQSLHFITWFQTNLLGTYRGYDEDRPDLSYDLSLTTDCPDPSVCFCDGQFYLENLRKSQCTVPMSGVGMLTNNQAYFKTARYASFASQGCDIEGGHFSLGAQSFHLELFDGGQKLRMRYEYYLTLEDGTFAPPGWRETTFTGVRID